MKTHPGSIDHGRPFILCVYASTFIGVVVRVCMHPLLAFYLPVNVNACTQWGSRLAALVDALAASRALFCHIMEVVLPRIDRQLPACILC